MVSCLFSCQDSRWEIEREEAFVSGSCTGRGGYYCTRESNVRIFHTPDVEYMYQISYGEQLAT